MKVRKCPKCESTKVEMFAGYISGTWECKKCGYVGALILEERIKK